MKFSWSRKREDLNAEIESHIQMAIHDRIGRGEPALQAEAAARREFGNVGLIKEVTRETWGWTSLERSTQDVRYGLRSLRKNPGFAIVAILTLALGIGSNTIVFTLVKGVFLQSLPVKDPSRLVMVYSTTRNRIGELKQYQSTSYLNAKDYRERNDVFSGLSVVIGSSANLEMPGAPTGVLLRLVNGDFFDILGVHPEIGRGFVAAEDGAPDAHPVVILSHAFWVEQFGGDPKILGQSISLNQHAFTVIGVAPGNFHNVGGLGDGDAWVPIAMHGQLLTGDGKDRFDKRAGRSGQMIARLKPGVSVQQAQASLQTLGAQLEKEYPNDNSGRNVIVVPLNQTLISPAQRGTFVLAGMLISAIAGMVLLIACSNVANLLLSRAMQRRREIAVRLSLGATRGRLVRQLFTESLVFAVAAGVIACFAAFWSPPILTRLLPGVLPENLDFTLDTRVLGFAVGICAFSTVLFGLIPAIQASNPNQIDDLKGGAKFHQGVAGRFGLRGTLVALQVALSLIALVSAGLFIHSLQNIAQVAPGFETDHEAVMFLNLNLPHLSEPQAEEFRRDLIQRLRSLPMVANASLADVPPLKGSFLRTTFAGNVDRSDPANGKLNGIINVEPSFFSTAGIALLRGRDFDEHDDSQSRMVAVVNDAAGERMWPGEDPVGKHLHFLLETWDVAVVGVVKTAKWESLGEEPQPVIYLPLKQHFTPYVRLYVRTNSNPNNAIPSILAIVRSLDSRIQPTSVQTGEQILGESLTTRRIGAELLGAFGALALLLAALGTYGVVTYSVSQRTHEIGIRMALGARPVDVLFLIFANSMSTVFAGIIAGLALALILTRSISSLLYGVSRFDAVSYLGAAIVLLVVALLACYIPARRAMQVDPMVALRYE